VQLVVINTSKELILTDTFVLPQHFATLQKTNIILSGGTTDLSIIHIKKNYTVMYVFVKVKLYAQLILLMCSDNKYIK